MKKPLIEPGADKHLALKVYMMAAGLNQKELASRAGLSEVTLSRKLRGNREFKINEVKAIAKALDLTVEETALIFLQ